MELRHVLGDGLGETLQQRVHGVAVSMQTPAVVQVSPIFASGTGACRLCAHARLDIHVGRELESLVGMWRGLGSSSRVHSGKAGRHLELSTMSEMISGPSLSIVHFEATTAMFDQGTKYWPLFWDDCWETENDTHFPSCYSSSRGNQSGALAYRLCIRSRP